MKRPEPNYRGTLRTTYRKSLVTGEYRNKCGNGYGEAMTWGAIDTQLTERSGEVLIYVDADAVRAQLVDRAKESKAGRATVMRGAIVVLSSGAMSIDYPKLLARMGIRALSARSGNCRALHGAVRVRAVKVSERALGPVERPDYLTRGIESGQYRITQETRRADPLPFGSQA